MDVLIPIIAIISIFFIPITGVMLTLVSRFALKPMVETLSEALRDSRLGGDDGAATIRQLTEQVADLTEQLRRLEEAQDFDRKLLGAADPGDS